MEVRLINCPSMATDELCGRAAAKCYRGRNFEKSLDTAMEGEHYSVLEHAAFTFEISGVSRVLLTQITRHRIASFSVESQRYCGVKPIWIIPQTVADAGYEDEYTTHCDAGYALMQEMMQQGVPAEDARYIIPQGVACSLMMTMNARELLHFFALRCCNRAQWEIRDLAWRMLPLCQIAAPKTFADAGPGCVRGACPEGKKACGDPYPRANA